MFYLTIKNRDCIIHVLLPPGLALDTLIFFFLSLTHVDIMPSALMAPYDLAEAAVLDSLLSKAKFENNRYRKPKRGAKSSSDYVDWM